MAVTWMCSFEAGAVQVDGITLSGTAAYSTTQARTGTRSIRCNPASGASGYILQDYSATYHHFAIYIASLPSVSRRLAGSVSRNRLMLKSDGSIEYWDALEPIGASGVLNTGQWYWIGWRPGISITGALLQIDGTTVITGTSGADAGGTAGIGFSGTEASAADIYIDDVIVDDTGFLAPSKVALLLPISDNARATLWTNGTGGTTNLYDAVNNVPPAGLATETATSQIEHAGGAAGSADSYDANLTTYSTAGVGSSDTIIALQALIVWGEDSGTGTKLLSYSSLSNPGFAGEVSIDVSTGHGSGATVDYSTGTDYWNERRSALFTSPTQLEIGTDIILGTSPVMRVWRPETASRVASVCFMGMYVAWTPAAVAANPNPRKVYPQLLAH